MTKKQRIRRAARFAAPERKEIIPGYSDASITYVLPAYGMIVVCSYHDYYTHSNDFCLNFDGDPVMNKNTIH